MSANAGYTWHKRRNDFAFDPKWAWVARRTSQPIERVIALADVLLGEAGEADPRGSIKSFSAEHIEALWSAPDGSIDAIFEAMMEAGFHDGERLINWAKHQPKDPTGAERQSNLRRVRALEQREKALQTQIELLQKQASRPVTASHVDSRYSSPLEEKTTTTEGARGFSNLRVPQPDNEAGMLAVLVEAAGACLAPLADAPFLRDVTPILELMARSDDGSGPPPCDLLNDILPAIAEKSASLFPGQVRSWRYYVVSIRQRQANRLADPLSAGLQQRLPFEQPRDNPRRAATGARAHSAIADGDVGARLVAARQAREAG